MTGMCISRHGSRCNLTLFRHKYTLFLSIDGNFKQQLKIKNCDQDDVELFIAFFANKAKIEAYLKTTSGDVEVRGCIRNSPDNMGF